MQRAEAGVKAASVAAVGGAEWDEEDPSQAEACLLGGGEALRD